MSDTPQLSEQLAKAAGKLKLRGIGPALMGGRIADIAVHPTKKSTWYIAVGSGGVWKTTNAGVTFTPIFDKQPSYSIACVTIDPTNPSVVWVGTGENVSGRHVGWGDGVYRSLDAGKTWKQMGLPKSEHIGNILVDPRDGNIVYAAAEGPLWSAGGERGLYKTTDRGETWEAILEIDENTGVTDIAFDPSNPDAIYAAAYQRRRHTWSFLGGGPSSGVYKSADSGTTWQKLSTGLPKGDTGKIGLATTPADPSVVYATIEADKKEKGLYRSTDRGASWEKRCDYISGGTGPHYYQVIEASPHNADVLYQMDVFIHRTRDGGKTMTNIESAKDKHSDNHALWIDPDDADHLLVGCDAGLYESFDEGASWRHFPNLPISQFYRCAVDNSEPHYNILGGAQDLGTLFGPSGTTNTEGVRNQDWWVPLGADGYHVAFDPEDPDTFYLEFQNGTVFRYNNKHKEIISIKPYDVDGTLPDRYNWDCPIVISPHNRKRIYVASQRVWRSDNRGDAWTPISGDLTRNRNRYEMDMMGRVWSVDSLYDTGAMSRYATITHLSESPVVDGLIYIGTDDGLIQVTENGGESWAEASTPPDMPELSFINDVEASQHDADTVFAVADAHKLGDFAPYIYESNDRGKTWRSISGDMPDGNIVWQVEQDHVNANLLFAGTEFGVYFSPNRGANWIKLSAGVPTIAFRDIKLHRRDSDLIGATFGRGFYILDDYTPLRDIADALQSGDGALFPVRDAWWFNPHQSMQAKGQPTVGASSFKAPNPPFGAILTYFLGETPSTQKEQRNKAEKELREAGESVPFPGWDTLSAESTESQPQVMILIRDANGKAVRWVQGSAENGLNRTTWDLRTPHPGKTRLKKPAFQAPWDRDPKGHLVAPGTYSATVYIVSAAGAQQIGETQTFAVKPTPSTPDNVDFAEMTAFKEACFELGRRFAGLQDVLGRTEMRLKHVRLALVRAPLADVALLVQMDALDAKLKEKMLLLTGNKERASLSENESPAFMWRIFRLAYGFSGTGNMPTETMRSSYTKLEADLDGVTDALRSFITDELEPLEAQIEAAKGPWTPGRRL